MCVIQVKYHGGRDLFNAISDEIARWAAIEKAKIDSFKDDNGLVNEFALMWHLRVSFPLHFAVFKQTASHMCHEGNTEQLFSLSGRLSDDNGKMDPHNLAVWTEIGANMKVFMPSTDAIMKRYFEKYSKAGVLAEQEDPKCCLVSEEGEVDNLEAGGYYARYGEHAP